MAQLILKHGSPSRRRDDYDVLENGVVVGRIFKVAVAPPARPPMDVGAHGYEPTREAAMAAFAKSWRRT